MQERSDIWKAIASTGSFRLETIASINGVEYTAISSPTINRALFANGISVGNCVTAALKFSVQTEDDIPKSAEVNIKKRLIGDDTISEWKNAGTFFVSKRSYDPISKVLTLQCYDALLKANSAFTLIPQNEDDYPKPMGEVVEIIAAQIGVMVDPRNSIAVGNDYAIPYPVYPDEPTMWEVLCYIAGVHGGNWVITPENTLRLIPLSSVSDVGRSDANTLNVVGIVGKLKTWPSVSISRVTISTDSESFTAGNDSGYDLNIGANPYATQSICDGLFEKMNGLIYTPFSIEGGVYDPAAELGDYVVSKDDVRSILCSETATYGIAFRANISAPDKLEIEDEFPYLSSIEKLEDEVKRIKRVVADEAEITSGTIGGWDIERRCLYSTAETDSAEITTVFQNVLPSGFTVIEKSGKILVEHWSTLSSGFRIQYDGQEPGEYALTVTYNYPYGDGELVCGISGIDGTKTTTDPVDPSDDDEITGEDPDGPVDPSDDDGTIGEWPDDPIDLETQELFGLPLGAEIPNWQDGGTATITRTITFGAPDGYENVHGNIFMDITLPSGKDGEMYTFEITLTDSGGNEVSRTSLTPHASGITAQNEVYEGIIEGLPRSAVLAIKKKDALGNITANFYVDQAGDMNAHTIYEDGVILRDKYILKDLIANSLTTTAEGYVLDARQGKVLADRIGALASLGTTAKGSIVAAVNELNTRNDLAYMHCNNTTITSKSNIGVNPVTSVIARGVGSEYFELLSDKRIKVKKSGRYLVSVSCTYSATSNNTNVRALSVSINGSNSIAGITTRDNTWNTRGATVPLSLKTNDILSFLARDEGGNSTIYSGYATIIPIM